MSSYRLWKFCCGLVLFGPILPLWGQYPRLPDFPVLPDLAKPPLVPADLIVAGNPSSARTNSDRIRLLGIQPGFLSDPLGLNSTDDPLADKTSPDDDDFDWLNITMGNDNPFFDYRRPGDPGGVGFTRLNTQVSLFDLETTACTIVLQAYTPSGISFDGLPDSRGVTVVTPAISLFQELGEGLALQAYVGKNLLLMNRRAQNLSQAVQYGVALQHALIKSDEDASGGFYLSFGALGQMRSIRESGKPVTLDVVPGLTWKIHNEWWITAGMPVPVSAFRPESVVPWQVTCRMQF